MSAPSLFGVFAPLVFLESYKNISLYDWGGTYISVWNVALIRMLLAHHSLPHLLNRTLISSGTIEGTTWSTCTPMWMIVMQSILLLLCLMSRLWATKITRWRLLFLFSTASNELIMTKITATSTTWSYWWLVSVLLLIIDWNLSTALFTFFNELVHTIRVLLVLVWGLLPWLSRVNCSSRSRSTYCRCVSIIIIK